MTEARAAAAPGGGLRRLVAEKDWARTPLGHPGTWSPSLRTIVATCLGSRFPVMVFWGRDLVQIYNDAYAPLIASKHPAALGQTAKECFPEIWHVIGPMLHGVLDTGEATWSDNQMLLLERRGFPEECYFTYSFGPAGGDPIEGVFCAVIETTPRVVDERRLGLLRELSGTFTGLGDAEAVARAAVEVLARHCEDLTGGRLILLEGGGSGEDLAWPREGAPALGGLEDELVEEVLRSEGVVVCGEGGPRQAYRPGRAGVVGYRLTHPGAERPVGVLVATLNPHIAFDEPCEDLVRRVGDTIGVAHAVASGIDATRRRARALEELDRAKTAFLSNVSHEFRTPLTLVLGPLHAYAADARLPADVREGVMLAERNGRRLLRLVNSLLDVARLEAGRVDATFQATDLSQMTADLASVFRSAAQAAGITWLVDCPELSKATYVDREMWEQIVTNLCANALKFTAEGSVAVSFRHRHGRAELEVADTGIGIPEEDLPHIFDRFRRVETPAAAARSGTGLGLALVRELVELHGGSVTARSALGVGSTFTVTVPLGSGHLDPARIVPETRRAPRVLSSSGGEVASLLGDIAEASAALETPRHGLALEGANVAGAETVWICDDNADMRDYLAGLLSPYWRVVAFDGAETALAELAEKPPDLIVSDVMMPGTSGLAFLAAIRAEPAYAQLPVVLLSARAGEEATLEGLEAGADDYLVKPFTARELVSRIDSHLRLARLRREVTERAAHHERQLETLAKAATSVVSAETHEAIVTAVEAFAAQMTGAACCRVRLAEHASPPEAAPAPDGRWTVIALRTAGGDTLGAIELLAAEEASIALEELNLVEQLALVVGRRIENMNRYRREHSVSHALQRSLLPDALPAVPRVELVARYRPASAAADDVGGDWYDALVLPDGRLMVTVGDVMGHDLSAAIAMGQIRLLIRARAADAAGPRQLSATVNALLHLVGPVKMATMVLAFVERDGTEATVVSAGHPPPVLFGEAGPKLVDVPPSLPLGVRREVEFHERRIALARNSTLFMYTDGLIERRREPLDVALEGLLGRLSELGRSPLEGCVDALLAGASPSTEDDIALLALRRRA